MTTEPKPRSWTAEEIYWSVEQSDVDGIHDMVFVEASALEAMRAERDAALASNRELREALDGVESILVCAAISPKEQLFDICETALKRASEALARGKGE